jgi:predicted PurR-regulated permease PerM
VATAGGAALALGAGTLAAIWFLQRPLAILVLALTVAAALVPAVRWAERWLPRSLAVVAVYLILALAAALLGLLVFPTVVDQAERMAARTPELADQAQRWLRDRLPVTDAALIDQLLSQIAGVGSTLVALPLEISSSILDIVLVVFLSLYTLIVAPQTRQTILSVVRERSEAQVNHMLDRLAHTMGGYVRGAAITGVVIGTLNYVGLLVIGVNFPLVLAILSAVFEFIPFIGPFIAGTLMVVVAFLQAPTKALVTLAFVIGVQQVEGNLVAPNVMHPQTCISPLTTLFAIFAGFSVGGVLGALIAVPVAAAARVLVVELLLPRLRRGKSEEVEEPREAC